MGIIRAAKLIFEYINKNEKDQFLGRGLALRDGRQPDLPERPKPAPARDLPQVAWFWGLKTFT